MATVDAVKNSIISDVSSFVITDIAKMIADFAIGDKLSMQDVASYGLVDCINTIAPTLELRCSLYVMALCADNTTMADHILSNAEQVCVTLTNYEYELIVQRASTPTIIWFLKKNYRKDLILTQILEFNRSDILEKLTSDAKLFESTMFYFGYSQNTGWLYSSGRNITADAWVEIVKVVIWADNAKILGEIIEFTGNTKFAKMVFDTRDPHPYCVTKALMYISESDAMQSQFGEKIVESAEFYRLLCIKY